MKTRKPRRKQPKLRSDPFAAREAKRYQKPIYSREYLLEFFNKIAVPLTTDAVAKALHMTDTTDITSLTRRLNAMVRDGQLVRNNQGRLLPLTEADLICGRVIGHANGFGFVRPEKGGDDLFLAAREMQSVFHNDLVSVRISGVNRNGKIEAAIVNVIKRNTHSLVGRFYDQGNTRFVVPSNKRFTQDIIISQANSKNAVNGQIVVAELLTQPNRHSNSATGQITEIVGDYMASGMETSIAIREHDIPLQWPITVDLEIKDLNNKKLKWSKHHRKDRRSLPFVTIDGADAKDFDDAVYCEKKPYGWRLYVAIADVAHYVRAGSALNTEALHRGTSVYFPEQVIPMLPPILANELCSLKPNVERFVVICEMRISHEGELTRSEFYKSIISSKARLTYDQVAAMLVDKDKKLRKRYADLMVPLKTLHRMHGILTKIRQQRGAISFESTETKFVFKDDGTVAHIVPITRNVAHTIIEECMILANIAAARFLERKKIPGIFRVHAGPSPEKQAELRLFLKGFGLELKGDDTPEPKDYANLLEQIKDRPILQLIESVLLRSLSQAIYCDKNTGHFGLALQSYTHFTSPIRRYPDLLVHRAIEHFISGPKHGEFPYSESDMQAFGTQCSQTERRADDATRDVISGMKCSYMANRIGDKFDGMITGVTAFGLFVQLTESHVDGLIHITSLAKEYFHFDSAQHRLTGSKSGTVYRLADKIRVQLVRVDVDGKKIDFELA